MNNQRQVKSAPSIEERLAGVSAAIEILMDELHSVMQEVYGNPAPRVFQSESNQVIQLKPKRTRRSFGRLAHGLKTPKEAFYEPILSALISSGGQLAKTRVLRTIGMKMNGVLKQEDLGRNRSTRLPRWHSTVNEARAELINRGLLTATTRSGVWEITELGRRWLEK